MKSPPQLRIGVAMSGCDNVVSCPNIMLFTCAQGALQSMHLREAQGPSTNYHTWGKTIREHLQFMSRGKFAVISLVAHVSLPRTMEYTGLNRIT